MSLSKLKRCEMLKCMSGESIDASSAAVQSDRRLGAAYWRLWGASGLSNLADGILKIALPLVAIQFTQSPSLIAGLTFALTVPWLLFALPAGAFADKYDRRRIMLGANALRSAMLGLLVAVIVVDLGSIWALYAVALGIGIAETLYDTSAQSILPQVVGRDQLSRANGRLYAAELTANQFIGPPLGGLLAAVGAAAAFATPMGLWVCALGMLLLVRGKFRIARTEPTTMRADIAEGLRFLAGHRILRTMAVMTGGFNFASTAAFALLVLFAVGPTSAMGLSEAAFGVLLTTTAAGSLLGSFIAEKVEQRLGRSRALMLAILTGAPLIGGPALTSNPYILGGAFFIGGISLVLANVIMVSLRQRITPDRLLGRVNSGYRLVAWGTMPLGAAVGGLLAELFGLQIMFGIMGLLVLSLLGLMPILSKAGLNEAEQET
jgi:MFS family permease